MGFRKDKPVAACIMYKSLLHWRAYESERTDIFNFIIEAINDVLKVIHLGKYVLFMKIIFVDFSVLVYI